MDYKQEYQDFLLGTCQLRKSTACEYLSKLNMLERYLNKTVDQIDYKDLQSYYLDIRERKSINSQRLEQTAINSFFKWYSEVYNMPNPAQGMKIIKKEYITPDILDTGDIQKMILACGANDAKSIRNAAIICVLADTGIRVGELIQLKVGDVQRLKDKFLLSITGSTKTFQQRQIPFCLIKERSLIAEYFLAYWQIIKFVEIRNSEDPLFMRSEIYLKRNNNNQGGLTISTIQQIIKKISKTAEINKNIHPHSFRHFYATYCTLNDMRLETLQHRLGHRKIDSTQRYIHIADSVRDDNLNQNPLFNIKVPDHNFSGFVKSFKKIK